MVTYHFPFLGQSMQPSLFSSKQSLNVTSPWSIPSKRYQNDIHSHFREISGLSTASSTYRCSSINLLVMALTLLLDRIQDATLLHSLLYLFISFQIPIQTSHQVQALAGGEHLVWMAGMCCSVSFQKIALQYT